MEKPEVFGYLDYRKFLKVAFKYYKKTENQFSQKWVLSQLGLNSSGFISNVFAGRKNLTPGQISKMAKLIKLGKGESGYFENLVYFTQAKTIEEKNEFFSRLVTLQSANFRIFT